MKELRKINQQELNEILRKHELWLKGVKGGKRANLSYTDLSHTDLSRANLKLVKLSYSNLSYSNLSYTNLCSAILNGADMRCANLSHSNLYRTILNWADMRGSILSHSNLYRTILNCADMRYTNLSHSNLYRTNLNGADMRGAILNGAKGLISPIEFLNKNFEKTDEGYVAYKTFNCFFDINPNWKIEVGSVIEEEVNYNRIDDCGCGINVATLDWVKQECEYNNVTIYKVLIRNEWLMGVCVPYNTNGTIRCSKVEIIGIVEG